MPIKAKKPCKYPGCSNLTDSRYCEEHKIEEAKERPSAFKRGYDNKWRKASKIFLMVNPFCIKCHGEGSITKATVVDHIKPHRGVQELFWDEYNWQPLCKKCHDTKTGKEDMKVEYRY